MATTCPVAGVCANAKPEQIQKFTRSSADVFKKHARDEQKQFAEIIKLLEELVNKVDCGYCVGGTGGGDPTTCKMNGGHWCPCTIKLSVQSK